LEHWECQFCTALNEPAKPMCWKCTKARALSDSILLEKQGASVAERHAFSAAQQQREQERASAIKLAEQLRQAGKLDLRSVLASHTGSAIGMNLKDPVKVSEVTLVDVQADHFAVESEGVLVRTPYAQVLRATEAVQGSKVKPSAFGRSYDLVLEVFHMVVYKGAVGVGVSIPI
jgi:hypothetical protein